MNTDDQPKKVMRYMSKEEFQKYLNGEELINMKRHTGYTTAVGFCFLDADEYTPHYSYQFISGVVNDEVCAIFEVVSPMSWLESSGRYADPYGHSFFSAMQVDEYSVVSYNSAQLKLIKYAESLTYDHDEAEKWVWKTLDKALVSN